MGERPVKKTVRLGGVTLGEGMPKVCVPVMGKNPAQLEAAARRAVQACADVIELRMDSLSASASAEEAVAACRAVRTGAPGVPLLFTQRTVRDGGAGSGDAAAYEALLCAVAESGACEAIDCELSVGEAAFARIVHFAHAAGVAVVGSSHEFGEIGEMRRVSDWLLSQEALGADVCKAAVMAHTGAEALEAMLEMTHAGERLACPMIAIAMGPSGVLTRIGAACIGSCLSFGTAGKASAPGQIDALRLRGVLETVQAALG